MAQPLPLAQQTTSVGHIGFMIRIFALCCDCEGVFIYFLLFLYILWRSLGLRHEQIGSRGEIKGKAFSVILPEMIASPPLRWLFDISVLGRGNTSERGFELKFRFTYYKFNMADLVYPAYYVSNGRCRIIPRWQTFIACSWLYIDHHNSCEFMWYWVFIPA